MSILPRSVTYDDLEHARELTTDRVELIDGELFVTPSPSPLHQLVVHRLAVLLDRVLVESSAGLVLESPLDVFLGAENIVQPDLIVLLQDRMRFFGANKIEGAPSLAIEIVSPSTGTRDRIAKRAVYARYGVPEYWLVDPGARTLTVCSEPRGDRYLAETTETDVAGSATIPRVSIDLKTLFAAIPGF